MCRNLDGLRLGQRWIPEDAPDDGRGIILPLSMMGLGDMTLKNSPLFPNIGGLLPCSLQSPSSCVMIRRHPAWGGGDISKDVALIVSTDETLQQPYPVSPTSVQSDGSGMHEGYCHDADDQRIIRDKTT